MMKTKAITVCYILVACLNLVGQLLPDTNLDVFTKPLLIPILIILVYHKKASLSNIFPFIILALLFSWVGDILLMMENLSWSFMGGLGAFLMAQLLYAFILVKATNKNQKPNLKLLVPVILYGIILLSILLPKAGNLMLPVLIYSLCILTMASSAILRLGNTFGKSYISCLFGAILFVLSDSLIAVNKFVMVLPMSNFLIMLTYIIAQYLLAKGTLIHYQQNSIKPNLEL